MKNKVFILSFLSLTSVVLLSGCSGLQVASMASMAVTGKGFGDHALSTMMGRDCAFINVVEGEQVCYSDDSVEMTLLTSNQNFDDSFKEITFQNDLPSKKLPTKATKIEPANAFLVIGSFRQLSRAESYRLEYQKWNSKVVKANANASHLYRVVIGPVAHEDKARLKRIFINKGVETPWLTTL